MGAGGHSSGGADGLAHGCQWWGCVCVEGVQCWELFQFIPRSYLSRLIEVPCLVNAQSLIQMPFTHQESSSTLELTVPSPCSSESLMEQARQKALQRGCQEAQVCTPSLTSTCQCQGHELHGPSMSQGIWVLLCFPALSSLYPDFLVCFHL